jgi:hypothetical protein
MTLLTSKRATLVALAASIFALTSAAHAADEVYTFQSVLSTPNASWCINVPGGEYQAGKHLAIAGCNGQPNQTFGYGDRATLTAGGFCLDGLAATPNQPPGAGDPVVIAECDGTDYQVWELPPFKNRSGVFAIANPDGLCVTVDGNTIAEGTPLVLAQCAELDPQGWVAGKTAANVAPAGVASEFYWYSGHRYCWYARGWHGAGWYWCGENLHRGIGWGGPIGWHRWHHRGQPLRPHIVHRVRPRIPPAVRHPPRVKRHPPRVTKKQVHQRVQKHQPRVTKKQVHQRVQKHQPRATKKQVHQRVQKHQPRATKKQVHQRVQKHQPQRKGVQPRRKK